MDECFQKEFFLSSKKKKGGEGGSKLVLGLFLSFLSVYYVEGKQAVTRDDKLVTVTWVVFCFVGRRSIF